MSTQDVCVLILAMAAVTYLPRALPVFFANKFQLGARAKKFFTLLPYTAMSALIFPGILRADAAHPLFGILGGIAAVFPAVKKCPLIVCVLAAVAVNCLLYLIF